MQPGWPSHIRTNGKSIFFGVDSSPFVSSWHLDEPLKGSAIQESPTSNIFQGGRDGKLNKGCTVHKGFNPNCMESRRKENFSEASAVYKGEFRNFFNVGVEEVNPLKQWATVTRVRSNSSKILRESKCGDSRSAVELRQPGASSLVTFCSIGPPGDGGSHKVNSARLMHP